MTSNSAVLAVQATIDRFYALEQHAAPHYNLESPSVALWFLA